jgi:single-strand DNA-binding protein
MPNLNSVHLMGTLTRDPEIRYTPSGTAVCDISLAINRTLPPEQEGGERREEVTYVDVTLWAKAAENAGKYLAKGRSVFVDGRLHLDVWDDRQTGQKRSKLKVVAEALQFLGPKTAGKGQGETPTPTKPVTQRPAPPRPPAGAPVDRDPELMAEPDDIPF